MRAPAARRSRSASSPIRWIERTFGPTAAASGAKSSSLPEPPAIRCTGSSAYAASARQRRGDVRRLRVVDEANPVALGDELQPVRHAGERAQPRRDVLVGDPGGARGGSRRSSVLTVVRAAQQRLGGQLVVGGEHSAVEPGPCRDDLRARPLEDAQLRVAVGVERPVTVEVVGLEVEQHRDVAGQLVHVLELERRQLADDPLHRLERRQRRADVARHRDVASRGTEDRAEQLGRRGLAVRPGDADEARAPGSSLNPSSTSDHTSIPRARAPRRRAAPRRGRPAT